MNGSVASQLSSLKNSSYKLEDVYNSTYGSDDKFVIAGKICQYLSLTLIIINMVGIGGLVDGEQILYLLRRPLSIGVSLLCRYGIMPAVSETNYHWKSLISLKLL